MGLVYLFLASLFLVNCFAFEVKEDSKKRGIPTDCVWDAWQAWSPCSVSCGARGFRSSIREVKSEPIFGGKECSPSDGVKEEPCSGPPCPIDCTWKVWSGWSPCSAKCGNGIQLANRTADPATNGGKDCTGSPSRNRTCFLHPCHKDDKETYINLMETHAHHLDQILVAQESLFLAFEITSHVEVESSTIFFLDVYLKAAKPAEVSSFVAAFEASLEEFLYLTPEEVTTNLVFNISEDEEVHIGSLDKKRSEDDFGLPHVQHLGIHVIVSPASEEETKEPEPEEDTDDLTPGQIVGISLGSFAAFLLIVVLVVLLVSGGGGGSGELNEKFI